MASREPEREMSETDWDFVILWLESGNELFRSSLDTGPLHDFRVFSLILPKATEQ